MGNEICAPGLMGGAREGAGRPEAINAKKSYTMRLADITVERIERFAKARGGDRTKALETMVEEYTLVLDQIMLPGRWHPEPFRRPGLKSIVTEEVIRKREARQLRAAKRPR